MLSNIMKSSVLISSILLTVILGCEPIISFDFAKNEDSIKILENQAIESFEKAEKKIYITVVPVNPDDGTHEDPKKCICRGTGIITHGDGHTSPCPFHGK